MWSNGQNAVPACQRSRVQILSTVFQFFRGLLVLSFYGQFLGFLRQFHYYGVTYSDYSLRLVVRLFTSVLKIGSGGLGSRLQLELGSVLG